MNSGSEKRLDRIFISVWIAFCVIYYLPGMIIGNLCPTSPVWYFERQIQWFPFLSFFRQMFFQGIFPAWCPHFYMGFPLLAYPPNFWYFPPDYIMLGMNNYQGLFFAHMVGFVIAGGFFYLMLRRLGLSAVPSSFGLLCFIGGPWFNIASAYDPAQLFTYPLALWGFAGILRDRIRLRYLIGLWLGLGGSLGFDLEQYFYLLSALFVSSIFLARSKKFPRILVIGISLGLALLFMLSPVINLAGYGPHTVRSQGITFRNYISLTPFPGLKILFLFLNPFPERLPVELQSFYPGLVCLLMFLLGVKRLGLKGILIVLFLLGFELYVIGWPPLCKFLFHIPIINKLMLHYSAAIVPYLGLAILASIGAEEFLKKKSRLWVLMLLSILLLIAICSLLLPMSFCKHSALFCIKIFWTRTLGLFITACLAGMILWTRRAFRDGLLSALILLALIFDASYLGFKLQPRARKKELEDSPAVLRFLSQEKRLVRFWTLSKYLYEDTLVHPLVGMNLPLSLPGTHSPLGYWRVPLLRMAKLINLVSPGYVIFDQEGRLDFIDLGKPRDPKELDSGDLFYLRLFNVGNIISRGALLKIPGLEYLGSDQDIHFYRLSQTLPRYYLVSKLKRIKEPEEILTIIKDQGFNPQELALVEDDFSFLESAFNFGRVYLKGFFPGKWEFFLNLPEQNPGGEQVAQYFLVISESYLPGWRAFASSEEVRVFRANYGFFGVALMPGQYSLTVVYRPFQTRIGLWCTVASIGFWLVIGVIYILPFTAKARASSRIA